MAINIQNLQYFSVCAENGSYKTAADKMFRSYQSVYQGIHQLQRDLGGELFIAENGRLELTDFGRYTLENHVVPLLQEFNCLQNCHDSYLRNKETVLRVVIDELHGEWFEIGKLTAEMLQRRHPQAQISCMPVHPTSIPEMLQKNVVELGMRLDTPHCTGLQRALSIKAELFLLVGPGHSLARQEKVTVEEIREEPLLFHNATNYAKMSFWQKTGLPVNHAVIMNPENPLTGQLFNEGKLVRPSPVRQDQPHHKMPYMDQAVTLHFDPPLYVESGIFYNPQLEPTRLMKEYLQSYARLFRRAKMECELEPEIIEAISFPQRDVKRKE